MIEETIIKQAIGVFFGLLQGLIVVLVVGAFTTWKDVRKLKRDLNEAFQKIRRLENERRN